MPNRLRHVWALHSVSHQTPAGKTFERPTAGIEDIVLVLQLVEGIDRAGRGMRFSKKMGMATEHEARLDHIQDRPNGRNAVIRFTTIAQPGRAAVREEHVNVAQSETLVHVSTPKEGQAFERTLRLGVEIVVEVFKRPIEAGNADVFGAMREREDFASLDVMEMLQWALASLHLSHHVWPIIVAINPVYWPGKRTIMTHIADLQKGIHCQCRR